MDSRASSARELLRQVRAERFKKANPKLEVSATVTASAAPPSAVFKFIDDTEVGSTKAINTSKSPVDLILIVFFYLLLLASRLILTAHNTIARKYCIVSISKRWSLILITKWKERVSKIRFNQYLVF